MNLGFLYSLQRLTAREDDLHHRLKSIPQYRELKELKESFAGYQKVLQQNKETLAEIERTIQELERQLAEGEAEQKRISSELYDGSVSSPRELEQIQEHLANVVDRCDQLQEELIILNGDRENGTAENKAIDREMQVIYGDFNRLKDQYNRIKINLEQELAAILAERKDVLAHLSPAELAWFEQRKSRFAGMPIGVVAENHSCLGCHTVLPAIMVRYAREKPGEVSCEYCGRVLYVPWAADR